MSKLKIKQIESANAWIQFSSCESVCQIRYALKYHYRARSQSLATEGGGVISKLVVSNSLNVQVAKTSSAASEQISRLQSVKEYC